MKRCESWKNVNSVFIVEKWLLGICASFIFSLNFFFNFMMKICNLYLFFSVSNACRNMECSHMCVLSSTLPSCICRNGKIVPPKTACTDSNVSVLCKMSIQSNEPRRIWWTWQKLVEFHLSMETTQWTEQKNSIGF